MTARSAPANRTRPTSPTSPTGPTDGTARTDRTAHSDRTDRRTTRHTTRHGARLLALVAAGALTLGAAAEAGSQDRGTQGGGAQDARRTAAGPPSQVSPFTGRPASLGPVLAVKFDNSSKARPHRGLNKADIVYVEKVEGGMSRLMGVYASRKPSSVGPVRSARESDVELLRQFGNPALAYSGVRSSLTTYLNRSPIYVRPHDKVPGAYFRSADRPAPHNLFVEPGALLRTAPHASRAADIGFRFGPAPEGGVPTDSRTVRYSGASHTFSWSPSLRRWRVSFDGSPAMQTNGRQMAPRTVVIQHVSMPPSKYRDVNGAATPYIKTVGQGRATVLRDGKAYETRWHRPDADSGTTFTRPDGQRMPFARGQVWVVYADR
ncbi:DUF3048 domain-containing protein [Streptomyces sp. B-S-A8]|uniref:DUF3048 domain-containing protein n=1 Tax=Streptomyces solicavernae TaxID=3043614 RepID=A0ABT6RLS5_9ACTN|nr:DUF3048 domain-containing protein [Streptomyces sp. B-S-A8]MDI3385382.1 DUF3048 domain-containing protein [Streptomyces sp. B-S-A8]